MPSYENDYKSHVPLNLNDILIVLIKVRLEYFIYRKSHLKTAKLFSLVWL
jgi:hypothetical protein